MEDVTNMEVIRKFVDANSLMAVLAPPEGEGKNRSEERRVGKECRL